MKKKILLAIAQLSGGGAERVVSIWANELVDKGYDVSILVFSRREDEYFVVPDVRIYSVFEKTSEYLKSSIFERIKITRRILTDISPDYMVSFISSTQIKMMFFSLGLGIKRIETIRINPWRARLDGRIQRWLWKMCYHTSYKIIVQASDQIDFFSKRDQKKCILIPNPISKTYIENYKISTSDTVKKFIAAGRITAQKNYPMMISAFSEVCKNHDDITLDIFGTGEENYMKKIQRIIDENGMNDKIKLMGRTTDIESEYKKNDVFLMTSDYEGLPNSLMEAMASRLICISTDCKTGPKDLIDDGINGFLVSVGDVSELASKIENVFLMKEDERRKMADCAREKILTHCSEKNSIEALCKIFK